MSNELAVSKAKALPMSSRGVQLQSLEDAFRFGTAVVQSKLAPRQFDTAEKVMIAVQHGLELGLTPMQSLQSITVINGRPCLWGDGLVALVRGSGKLSDMQERIEGTGDQRKAICTVSRVDQASRVTREFSVQDAMKASLWNKPGPWKQYPDRMLQVRARAFALRDTFADVLCGIGFAEEVRDYVQPQQDRIEDGDEINIGDAAAEILGDDFPEDEKAAIRAEEQQQLL